MEYHRRVHRELGATPLERDLGAATVGRPSPAPEELRRAFRALAVRTQRRSDGTLTLLGRRVAVPSRFRHRKRLHLRYAGWDLSCVDLVDEPTGEILSPLYPLDKRGNSSGRRRRIPPQPDRAAPPPPAAAAVASPPASGMAPLLSELLANHAATGLPPAYLPKESQTNEEEQS